MAIKALAPAIPCSPAFKLTPRSQGAWRLAVLIGAAGALALNSHLAFAQFTQLPPIPMAPIGQAPPPSSVPALPIYPHIVLNGAALDAIVRFYLQNGDVYANTTGLEQLGISLKSSECAPHTGVAGLPADYFALKNCPPFLQHSYAVPTQTLTLQSSLDRLNLATTHLGAALAPAPVLTPPDFSAVLNHDSSLAGASGSSNSAGLYTQWRLGTPWGYFESNQIYSRNQGINTSQRLDTFWRSTWPAQGITLTVGDTVSSQLSSSGGSRMAGLQLASSYNTRPWLQTLPQTLFAGSTEMPATVDLYLNGIKQYSQNIAAGPYELNFPPNLQQAGIAQVVTKDALGRQTVVDLPLYDSAGLLAAGLQEWSVEAGFLRRPLAHAKNYDTQPLFSGTWRRGLSNQLTLQLHGESKSQYQQIGLGFRSSLGFPQQLGGQLALSRWQGISGQQASVFAIQQKNHWSLSAGLNASSAQFASLASTLSSSPASPGQSNRQAYVQGGWQSAHAGNFSLGRVWSRQAGTAQSVWNANWNKTLAPSTNLTAGLTYSPNDPLQRTFMLGLSSQLDSNVSASSSATHQAGGNDFSAQLQKSTRGINSLGWNVGWQRSQNQGQRALNAGLQYISPYGDASAQWRYAPAGHHAWQANWSGGLVFMGGSMFATRTVSDSFALVSTNGVAGLSIQTQNNVVGQTDAKGQLLIPNLLAYQNNRIAVDTRNLAPTQQLAHSQRLIVPYEKSGARVRFDIETLRAWRLTLRDEAGKTIPAGANLLDAQRQALTVVGFDGQLYLENVPIGAQNYQVLIPAAGGAASSCHFSVDFKPSFDTNSVHDFGAVTCLSSEMP